MMAETTGTPQSIESGNARSLQRGSANLVAWAAIGLALVIGVAGWIMHGSQASQMTGLEKKLTAQQSARVDRLKNQIAALGIELSRSNTTMGAISGGINKLQIELKGMVAHIKKVERTAAAAMSSIQPAAGAVRTLRSDLKNLRQQDANSARSGQAATKKAAAEIAVLRSRLAVAERAIKAANARALDALKAATVAAKANSHLAKTSDEVAKIGRRLTALDERMIGTVKRVDALSKQLQTLTEQVSKTERQ